MRAIAIDRFGGPDTLKLATLPDPTPGKGEVLVRVVASGVNPVDWKIREGMLEKRLPHRFPLIPGWEAAGYVEAAGPGATRFHRGDAVWTYARKPEVHGGTYAELLAVPARRAWRLKPVSMLFHEAAAVPLAGLTGVPGAVPRRGSPARHHGARPRGGRRRGPPRRADREERGRAWCLGDGGRASNLDFVKGLGADHAIDHSDGDFRDAVRKLYPEGVQIVFDTVGGEVAAKSYDVVAKGAGS